MIIKSLPFKIITKRPTIQSISVSPSSIEISSIGGTYKPVVNFTPSTVIDKGLTYKSENTKVAVVDEEGIVTAIGEGTTNIVITTVDGSKTAKLKVTVKIPTVGLSVNKSEHTFSDVNQSMQLIATLSSDTAKSVVTWSSTNTSVATVDSTGLVTSKSVGMCQIKATTGDLTVTTAVTVEKPVTAIKPSTYNVDVEVGKSTTVSATVSPSDATDKTLVWGSLNEAIATVDNTGKITGVSNGTCRIMITSPTNDYIFAYITVNVGISPTGISVSPTNLTFGREYEIKQVIATVLPSNANNKTVTWTSSNSSVAEVAQDGSITSIGKGTCVITATNSKGHKATVNVTVDIAPTSLTLDKNDVTLTKVNQTSTIKATVLPSNASNKTVTWTSSNPSVATVSSSGVVTAKTMGTTTITARTHNDLIATTVVTVDIPCESITLNQTSISVNKIGKTFNLVATALPTAITNPTFTWTSTDEKVAMVDSNGLVTITGFGDCIIKASYDGKEASCTVASRLIPVTGITLKANRCTFDKLNQTFQIEASVLPTDATYTDVEYNIVTENPGFSVSKTGLITCTGILAGTIEVVAHNGVKAVFNAFTDAINIAIGDYSEKLGNLREAMQVANEKIAQVKTDIASDNINTEIANLSSKVNKEIGELDTSLSDIRDNVLAGIEDGVLTDIEKARIESSLDSLKAEKADVDAQYQELYNNTYLVDTTTATPKTNLSQSYSNYVSMYNNVFAEIEAMLELTEINSVHKNMYATKLQNCINAYQVFKRNAIIAIDSIAQRKADLLYNDAKTYADAKIKVESDKISSTVSIVENVNSQMTSMQSSFNILAGQINSKVDVNGVSSVIQQNPESVRIAFNGISSGMTVTRYGIELKTNGSIHSILQNGRLEVMKYDGSSRLAYVGRSSWDGTNIEGCFINSSTGCTLGLAINNVVALAYSLNTFQTANTTVYSGLNFYTHCYCHNYHLKDVGALYTKQVTIGANYVNTPILQVTSQIQAQTVHVYDWCQAKRFVTYTNATYQTRSGETKTISIEKSCVDAITPNTEYIGTAEVIDGIATVELPPTLYSLGSTYVVQITPIGDKKIFVSKKDIDSFIVEGEDCKFDYVIKVSLPNIPKSRCATIEKIDDFNDSNGVVMDYIE